MRPVTSTAGQAIIWIYFFLLIFEGALRKWLLPTFSDPLLLIRDPFALLIYAIALQRGIFPLNRFTAGLTVIGIASVVTGITIGSRNMLVTAYGFDSLFFHLPLVFIIPEMMNKTDVLKIGKWLLVLAIPMAVLMTIQFRSSPDAFINCGVSGSLGTQIRGAMGKIRPPGVFSFITGAAQFLGLTTAFLIYGLWTKRDYGRVLLLMAGIAIAVSAVVSTSRLALGSVGTVFVMIGIILLYDKRGVTNALGILIPIGVILVIATNLDVFHEGRQVFDVRLEEAGDKGAGFVGTASNWTNRAFGDFVGGFLALEQAPIFGAGLGVGTNVGARVLSGQYGFLLSEGEWARVILELGPALGTAYLSIRCLICLKLFTTAAESARRGNSLPMLLFGACAMLLLTGQFSQASTLGFAALGSGLCLAAAIEPTELSEETDSHGTSDSARVSLKPKGCSDYAKSLHSDQD